MVESIVHKIGGYFSIILYIKKRIKYKLANKIITEIKNYIIPLSLSCLSFVLRHYACNTDLLWWPSLVSSFYFLCSIWMLIVHCICPMIMKATILSKPSLIASPSEKLLSQVKNDILNSLIISYQENLIIFFRAGNRSPREAAVFFFFFFTIDDENKRSERFVALWSKDQKIIEIHLLKRSAKSLQKCRCDLYMDY